MSNYKNFIYFLLFLTMQEIFINFVFIFVIFSPLFYSIFYMKRKEIIMKKKIKEMEYNILNLKRKETDLNNKIIELEHELKMCKEELRIEKVKTRKLTFVMLTSKQ